MFQEADQHLQHRELGHRPGHRDLLAADLQAVQPPGLQQGVDQAEPRPRPLPGPGHLLARLRDIRGLQQWPQDEERHDQVPGRW